MPAEKNRNNRSRTSAFLLSLLAIMCTAMPGIAQTVPPRQDQSLDSTWKFNRADAAGAEAAGFNDAAWTAINLPHTWNNLDGQDGGNNYYRGIGWYRKHFTVSNAFSGKSVFIKFEGANTVADIYLNGTLIGTHKGGFSAFCFDVTSRIAFGADNVVAVKVNNIYSLDIAPLSADFTFFGGIYRSVHLLVTDKLAITPLDYASPGVYLKTTNVSAASGTVQVTAKVRNNYTIAKAVTLNAVIIDAGGNPVKTLTGTQTIAANGAWDFVQSTVVISPHLWNGLADPYLYKVTVTVLDGGTITDSVAEPLGFRFFRVSPDSGFFLNGAYLDLRGVNRHQDRLDKGWAIGRAEHLEDFNLIKEMGCTAIRLAHYQHAGYFYDLCDTNGMVVWAEIPIVNNVTVSDSFYVNAKQQLRELIRQNLNHPAICFWSIGNEIHATPDPNPLLAQLSDSVYREDSTRISAYASDAADNNVINTHTTVIAHNKYFGWYTGTYNEFAAWADNIHAAYPLRRTGISEYGAGAALSQHEPNPVAVVPGSLWHPEEYQSLYHEAHWTAMKTRNYLWCKFIWNMFDFAVDGRNEGDTPGRNDKGMVSYDRKTRKDAFYWYKANWSTVPFVYIASRRFSTRTDSIVYVKAYSNTDTVRLYVNNVLIGAKSPSDHIFKWDTVGLAAGANVIKVTGVKQGVACSDSCVWTRIVVPVPISQNKPATASTSEAANLPQGGNDGNMQGTRWTASSAAYPQWWMVDLGTICRLDSAVITWYGGTRIYKYTIETSNSATAGFTTIVNKSNNTDTGTTKDVFSATGRFVRITVTGESTAAGWASFYEAKIWGASMIGTTAPSSSPAGNAIRPSWYVVNNRLHVRFPDAGVYQVKMINTAGRVLATKTCSGIRTAVLPEPAPSGLFFVQISSRKGICVNKALLP